MGTDALVKTFLIFCNVNMSEMWRPPFEPIQTTLWGEKREKNVHCVCLWERMKCVIAVTDRPFCKVIVWEHLKGCQSNARAATCQISRFDGRACFPPFSHPNEHVHYGPNLQIFYGCLKKLEYPVCSGCCCCGITQTEQHHRTSLTLLLAYCYCVITSECVRLIMTHCLGFTSPTYKKYHLTQFSSDRWHNKTFVVVHLLCLIVFTLCLLGQGPHQS